MNTKHTAPKSIEKNLEIAQQISLYETTLERSQRNSTLAQKIFKLTASSLDKNKLRALFADLESHAKELRNSPSLANLTDQQAIDVVSSSKFLSISQSEFLALVMTPNFSYYDALTHIVRRTPLQQEAYSLLSYSIEQRVNRLYELIEDIDEIRQMHEPKTRSTPSANTEFADAASAELKQETLKRDESETVKKPEPILDDKPTPSTDSVPPTALEEDSTALEWCLSLYQKLSTLILTSVIFLALSGIGLLSTALDPTFEQFQPLLAGAFALSMILVLLFCAVPAFLMIFVLGITYAGILLRTMIQLFFTKDTKN